MKTKLHGIIEPSSLITYFISENPEPIQESDNWHSNFLDYGIPSTNQMSYNLKHVIRLQYNYDVNLFHEKVHSWQAVSSPILFVNHISLYKLLKLQSGILNLNPNRLSDTFPGNKNDNIDFIKELYDSFLMNFDTPSKGGELFRELKEEYIFFKKDGFTGDWEDFCVYYKEMLEEKYKTRIYNIIAKSLDIDSFYNEMDKEKPVAMPMLMYNHKTKGKVYYTYAGLLDYFEIVYFSGKNLMESFAYVNDCLKKNISIPSYDSINNCEHNTYLGAFEFYRRVLGNKYNSERDLAISFLAIIDITFCPDLFGNHDEDFCDLDWKMENVSLGYRFGKLVFRAQNFQPLIVEKDDIANSIKKWQDSYCKYQGFVNIDLCIKNSISHLLTTLIIDLYNYQEVPKDILKSVLTLNSEDENWSKQISLISAFMNEKEGYYTCQYSFLSSIINVLYYKLNNRAHFVVPCYFEDKLDHSIDTPLFIYNGQYFANVFKHSNTYLLKNADDSKFGAINMLVMKPWINGDTNTCGFITERIPCMFNSNGLGCPLLGLTEDEKQNREKRGLTNDWCHRKKLLNDLSEKGHL